MASNQFSLTGEVLFVGDVVQVKDTFRKRDLVIEVPDGNYPQPVKFQATQDRCQLLDNVRTGQTITVHFNIRGNHSPDPRTGESRYFNNLDLWRIEGGQQGSQPQQKAQPKDDFDDVPF